MSKRDKILLGAVAAIVVVAGAWFGVAKPKRAEMSSLDAQIVAKQSEVDGAAAQAAQYRAARDRLLKDPKAFAEADRALPNRVAMSDLLRTLTSTAQKSGVVMSDFTASGGGSSSSTPTPAAAGISSVGLQLTFGGSFLSLQHFLGRLQHMVTVSRQNVAAKGRLLAVNGVALTPDPKNGLSAKVDATVYVLQPGALTASAATTGATTTSPTASGGTQ